MTTFIAPTSAWRTALATMCLGSATLGIVATDSAAGATETPSATRLRNIVLVHGAWVDGSGWAAVHRLLTAKGYRVSIVQPPLTSLAADVAATRAVLAAQDGPAVLVGHSYGGAVITEAGNDPRAERLVYIAAFAPDKDESVRTLVAHPPEGAPAPPILPPADGFLLLDRARFAQAFGADLPAERAEFLASAQVPWGLEAFGGTVSAAAWRSKASWYLVATDDRMIPPDAQRAMSKRIGATVRETAGSHAIYESHPQVVADLIEQAALGRGLSRTAGSAPL